MDNDDIPVGRVLSRREAIALLGGTGAALFLGSITSRGSRFAVAQSTASNATRSCIARPELTEGPFFVDEGLNRSDIRADPATGILSAGVPLEIAFNVSRIADGCVALPGAIVDVWQCDALGRYSDVGENGTVGQKFLRGSQVTDAQGVARFTTIYPGWYQGRAVHIHFKIRNQVEGRTHEFTSQLFLDDALTDKVHRLQPYAQNGQRTQRNNRDGIFQEGGQELILAPVATKTGYAARFEIGLDLTKPSSSGRGPGGRGPGGGPGGPGKGPGSRGPGRGGPGGPPQWGDD